MGSAAKTTKISIVQKMKEDPQLNIEARVALYKALKKESPDAYSFDNEDELTMYGYAFLWENKVPEAIAIFKLIAAEFPNSANAYDSLGEAYLKNGEKERSLANYEKSWAMNPDNFNHLLTSFEKLTYENPKEYSTSGYAREYQSQYDLLLFYLDRIV